MKKKLIAIAAAVVTAACTVTAYAASAEMEGLPVDIQDWDTPLSLQPERIGPSQYGIFTEKMERYWAVSLLMR